MLFTSLNRWLSLGKLDDSSSEERTKQPIWDLALAYKMLAIKIESYFVKPNCHLIVMYLQDFSQVTILYPWKGFSSISLLVSRPLPCTAVDSDVIFSSNSITVFVCPDACSTRVTSFSVLSNWSRTAWTMGTIMAVVAVLLIHIDRKAVTAINPSIRLKREKDTEERGRKWTDAARLCRHCNLENKAQAGMCAVTSTEQGQTPF